MIGIKFKIEMFRRYRVICLVTYGKDSSPNHLFHLCLLPLIATEGCSLGTLKQTDMEECTEQKTFDYFDGSEVSYALTFLCVGLFVVGKRCLL